MALLQQYALRVILLGIGAGGCGGNPSAAHATDASRDVPSSPDAPSSPLAIDVAALRDAATPDQSPRRFRDGGDAGPRDATTDALRDSGGFAVDPETLHLIAFGDYGSGAEAQFAVASAMERWCAAYRCDAALTLGDNIYDNGIANSCDPLLQERFEIPYANLDFPFYIVVGNHDRGSPQNLTPPIDAMLAYAARGGECGFTPYGGHWTMPGRFYAVEYELAVFIALDTTLFDAAGPKSGGPDETALIAAQEDLASAALAEAATRGRWKIAFGHHPYPPWSATQESLRRILCAGSELRVDLYLSGHSHHLRYSRLYRCGIDVLVSGGGGAELEPLEDTTLEWGASAWGFVWLELSLTCARVAFVDQGGAVLYQYTRCRG